MYKKSIKSFLENKRQTCFSETWLPPCLLFLSYSIFWLIPIWSIETHRVYLFAWASKTRARGSPRCGYLRYSSGPLWPYIDCVSLLSEALLAFYVNQGIQPLSLLYSNQGRIFWFFSRGSRKLGVPLKLKQGPQGTAHVASGKSSLNANCEGPLEIPLQAVQWPISSSRVKAGTSGFLSSADIDLELPMEFQRRCQASSLSESWKSAFLSSFKISVRLPLELA